MLRANQKGIAHLPILALIVFVVAAIGFTGYMIVKDNKPKPKKSTLSSTTTTLNIDSNPVGISMSGNPNCDSSKLHKVTPYMCTQSKVPLSTVVTAPAEVTINNKTYSFNTWDGCSASNADKKVCKVIVGENTAKTIKASYVTSANTKPGGPLSQSNSTNDQNCTVNEEPGQSYGLGTSYAAGSTNGLDSTCTMFERNPPKNGFNVIRAAVFNVSSTSCSVNCSQNGQAAGYIHSTPNGLIVNLTQCYDLSGTVVNGCGRGADYNYYKPFVIKFRAFEQYNQYYDVGCPYYYCSALATFKGWQTSVQSGATSASPSIINVIGNYDLLITVNPNYTSNSNNDFTRADVKNYLQGMCNCTIE